MPLKKAFAGKKAGAPRVVAAKVVAAKVIVGKPAGARGLLKEAKDFLERLRDKESREQAVDKGCLSRSCVLCVLLLVVRC